MTQWVSGVKCTRKLTYHVTSIHTDYQRVRGFDRKSHPENRVWSDDNFLSSF